MSLNSCVYVGNVRHRRFKPRAHDFQYRLFMMYLDLSEIERVFSIHPLWSSRPCSPAQFRRRDHFGDQTVPLEQSVTDLIQRQTGSRPQGPIRLLTHLRYFGYCFNPVSFYFCFDQDDQTVETIVAEVNNTPWGETHCYVLDDQLDQGNASSKRYEFGKSFHVSPFMPMAVQYRWHFTDPGRALTVHMENNSEEGKFFDATMVLQRKELTRALLGRLLWRYPFMTGKVIAAIHWNALLLWIKGTPFYTHPDKINRESEI